MSDKTAIEWTDATWNPVTGCNQLTPGCGHCYAKELHDRRHTAWKDGRFPTAPEQYHTPFETVQLHPDRLLIPYKWKSPRKIFVNSMSDLFHSQVNWGFIDQVFATMFSCNAHTFQVLTKRAAHMRDYMCCRATPLRIATRCFHQYVERLGDKYDGVLVETDFVNEVKRDWPPKNIWLGVSVEDQKRADERIPLLIETPAAVRFLSCEPLLGPVDLDRDVDAYAAGNKTPFRRSWLDFINQVIVGGESGPDARRMNLEWARALRDLCAAASVAFFFKQWGEWGYPSQLASPYEPRNSSADDPMLFGKKHAGRLLDGREWSEYPKSESVAALA